MNELGSVLIVDDNPNNLQVLMALLEQAGYKVRPALSGEVALRAIEVSLPDLILLDVRMPGMNGYETCRRLQANEKSRDIPVIFISAMDDMEDKLEGFRAGGVDYIAKPFQAEEVLARVMTHVQLRRIRCHMESMVKERTVQLSQSESRYRVLFEDSPIAILVFDTDNLEILAVNGGFTRMLGYGAEEAIGRSLDFASTPKQKKNLLSLTRSLTEHSKEAAYTERLQLYHREGHIVDIEGVLQTVEYIGHRAQMLMLQDVTAGRLAEERLQLSAKEHQTELEQTANYDALTGLPNRAQLSERMRQGVEQTKRTGSSMAVCYLDLDAFKTINENYGQAFGDLLLLNTAENLRCGLRGGDTLARIGGDEFALILLGVNSDEELDQVLNGILVRLSEPFVEDGVTLTLSASIGVAVYPMDDVPPDTLLRHADQAMVMAKQSGKARWMRFDPDNDKLVRAQRETIELMRAALSRKEFVLYYQPKVDVEKNAVVGAEALIRWQHPERGLLHPGVFLPQIEGDSFMIELGDWVIDEALCQMALWRSDGLDLAISVNVAALQLVQENFIVRLHELLVLHQDTPHGMLELEVLETSGLDDIDKVEKII